MEIIKSLFENDYYGPQLILAIILTFFTIVPIREKRLKPWAAAIPLCLALIISFLLSFIRT